jgi:hypothetical protein
LYVSPVRLQGRTVLVALALATAAGAAEPPADRYEPGALPAVGGDTDVGLVFSAFVQLARFRDGEHPYSWRARGLAAGSVYDGPAGTEFPYREGYVAVDWPHVFGSPLRLLADAGYAQTTNFGYYGVGNERSTERRWEGLQEGSEPYVAARRYYQYDGASSLARLSGIYPIAKHWNWTSEVSLRWVTVRSYGGSLLQRDLAEGAGAGQKLWGADAYVQPALGMGVSHDSRNHETVTTGGMYHDGSILCSPRMPGVEPYCRANVTLRGYVPIAGEKLSFAGRAMGDVLSSRAPLYELARFGGLAGGNSLAGGRGIRGAPAGRLQGRTKVVVNLEVRSFFLPFSIGSQRLTLGVGAFVDAGRVWVDPFASVRELDGTGPGIHWGAGGGPRLRWGDSLVVRGDFAYSPLGASLGVAPAIYVDIDQVM